MKNIGLITKVAGAALVLATGLMTGCGSSSGSSTKTGVFEDAAVIGISYKTATQEGTTDADGKFKYKKGETVTFFIGNIELPGGIPQDGIITPAHLAGTADWETDDTAINIIRFLLSIDEDQDPDNGIQIPEDFAAFADEYLGTDTVDFSDSGFITGFGDLLGAYSLDVGVTYEVVSDTAAISHFTATIEALGITIEIEVSTEAGPCTSGNTADIQGRWDGSLSKTFGDPSFTGNQIIFVEGTGLSIAESSVDVSTCTYTYSEVTGAADSLIDTWTWVDGTDTYTLVTTELVGLTTSTSFTATESSGTAVSSGTVTRAD